MCITWFHITNDLDDKLPKGWNGHFERFLDSNLQVEREINVLKLTNVVPTMMNGIFRDLQTGRSSRTQDAIELQV